RRLLTTRECEGCSLRHAELAGADLRNTRLKGAGVHGDLHGADFRGADLTNVSFSGDLTQVDFRGAKIEGASFCNSVLKDARFDGMDLREVKFADATHWSGAILRDVNLEHVSFYGYGGYHRTQPKHPLDVSWGGTYLNSVDLRGANLREAFFAKSDLRRADLRGADLRNAVMPYPEDLQGAQLSGAIWIDGRRCAEGSVGYCIPEGNATRDQRRRRKN
ncbi:MAG TPA: pentapeptide repeat-containing protein, partial [Polyangiaceae bacterium]|nr:pentapeptide repeat-containing protein [Polyangiaceae bacterium]